MADEEFIERRQFLAALQAKERECGRGFQKQLAGDTGYSDSYINQIIKGKRGLSFKAQSRIAKALKYKYADFLEMGKNILDGITGQGDLKAATPISVEWKDKYIACMEDLIEAKKEIERLRGAVKPLKTVSGTPKRRRGAVA